MAARPLHTVVSTPEGGAASLTTGFEALLQDLNILADNPAAALDETKVIKAVATNLSKYWALLAGAAGGALSVTNIVAALKASQEPTKVSLIAAASVTLAATLIAVALIVRADLMARAKVTVALYRSRTDITDAVVAASRPEGV